MDTKVNVLSDSEHEIEINLGYDEIKEDIDKAYLEERKSISHPGFRKGNVPLSLVKKLYGEAIEYKASEKIANSKFWEVVEKENLKPISTPELSDLDFQIGEKLFFKIKYDVKPELELKNYTGLEIERPIFKLKEEDIQKEIDYVFKSNATFEDTDEVKDKDYKITVDLQRLDENNKPMGDQKSENLEIDLSDPNVHQQITENAMNKKVGDTVGFTFTDEHSHGEEKHVVDYIYSAEIKKIQKPVYPEATKEFIKKISKDKASSLDELREQIEKDFTDYYNSQSDKIYSSSLLDTIVKNNDFEPPKGYVENLHKRMVEMEKENAKRYNQPVNENVLSEQLKPKSVWNAKWQLILENLAEKENIKVEDSDIEEAVKTEAVKTGISVDKLIKFYKDSGRVEVLLEEKVIKFLKENNKLIEVDAEKKMKEQKAEKEKEDKK